MKPYVLRRLALAIPTLVLVSVIVFSMMRLMPGDVVIRMVEGHAYAPTIEALRKELGLDRPAYLQYFEWIGGILLRGDFGNSYWTRQPILDEFVGRFPVTIELAALTILVSVVIGVLVGIVSAVRQDTVSDYVGRILAILALSVPYFGLAVLVVVLPSIYFKWTPVWTYVPFTTDPLENLKIMSRAGLRLRHHPRGADHAHHAVGPARGHAPGLHPHRVVEGTAGAERSCSATGSRTR